MNSIETGARSQREFDLFDERVLEAPISRSAVVADRVVSAGFVLLVAPLLVAVALGARFVGAVRGESTH